MLPPSAATDADPSATGPSPSAMGPGSPGLNISRVSLTDGDPPTARREILELRKETNFASKHARVADAQLQAVKAERRKAQSSLEAKHRETNFLRREVERVTAERDALQASVSGDRAYIRRLERKMTAGGPDDAERCAKLRARVAKLRDELDAANVARAAALADRDAAVRDKASLSHALNLRAKELSAEGGEDVPSRLLYAVAKGREEAVSLAVQLAEKSEALRRERDAILRLNERVESLEASRKTALDDLADAHAASCDADARAIKAREDASKAVTQAQAEAARSAALAEEATADAEALGAELARERRRGDALRKALEESEIARSSDLETIREEMELAIEATEREAGDKNAETAKALEEEARRVAELEAALKAARGRAESDEDANRRGREVDGRAKDALEAELARTKAHARALEEEAANLTAQIEAFAVVNARLQDAATSAQSRLDAQTAATENLKAQVATLEATIRASQDATRASEGELKTKLRGALEELSKCIATRDETRVALQETMAKCASAMARTERAEESERATRKANDALARSKKMLQETMVEQLAAVRAQLDRARAQSDQLERAVGRKKAQEDRLRAETTSGERGEDAGGDGEET